MDDDELMVNHKDDDDNNSTTEVDDKGDKIASECITMVLKLPTKCIKMADLLNSLEYDANAVFFSQILKKK